MGWVFSLVVKTLYPKLGCLGSTRRSSINSSFLLMHTLKAEVMAQVFGSLPPTRETLNEFLAPGFSLVCCGHLGTKPVFGSSVCLFSCFSN